MAILDTTAAAAVLKTYYSGQRVQSLTYKDAPLYAMLEKVKDFYGASYPLPMRVASTQGRSSTFANAQAQKTASNYKTFQLTRIKNYSLASISTEAMLASENDAGAFLKLATGEIDSALEAQSRSVSWSLYGTGAGNLAQVSAAPSVAAGTFYVTLSNVEDISKIEDGQTLQIWSATSGGTQRTSDGTTTQWVVASVDRDAGTVGLTGTVNGSSTITTNDYFFVAGDRGSMVSGLAGWFPSTAPTAGDNWFGVDRSIDATRLAGVRINCQNKPADEALIDAARRMGREGAAPSIVMSSFQRFANLEKTLSTQVRRAEVSFGGIGFTGIEVQGPKGTITVLPDRDCPPNTQYMLTPDSLALYSLKDPIMLLDQDGNKMLREATADSLEVRVGGYYQLGCNLPRNNGVLSY